MARCRECIHFGVCENVLLKLAADTSMSGKCKHFIDKNDVAPKSEVAREIFEEIEKSMWEPLNEPIDLIRIVNVDSIAKLKKKYTEG